LSGRVRGEWARERRESGENRRCLESGGAAAAAEREEEERDDVHTAATVAASAVPDPRAPRRQRALCANRGLATKVTTRRGYRLLQHLLIGFVLVSLVLFTIPIRLFTTRTKLDRGLKTVLFLVLSASSLKSQLKQQKNRTRRTSLLVVRLVRCEDLTRLPRLRRQQRRLRRKVHSGVNRFTRRQIREFH